MMHAELQFAVEAELLLQLLLWTPWIARGSDSLYCYYTVNKMKPQHMYSVLHRRTAHLVPDAPPLLGHAVALSHLVLLAV